MRIISGIFKSRVLKTPTVSAHVRPTTDRARETLFNILNNRFDFKGAKCLDLFCGTGSFGLECISRGAGNAVFVDRDTSLVARNVEMLKAREQSQVVKKNVSSFLLSLDPEADKFDLIFADPPYDHESYDELIDTVSKFNGFFILEHSEKYKIPEEKRANIVLEKKIGISAFTFFDHNK